MNTQLQKPLCVFDLETTGLQITKDRIVQIAAVKIHPGGKQEELNLVVNPEMTIPQEVIDIHGITNEIALKAPNFAQQAEEIKSFFGDSDLAVGQLRGCGRGCRTGSCGCGLGVGVRAR